MDAATVLLEISTKALPNPIPFEVIQANQLVKTDALLCFEWSFREWQGVDRLLWPKDLRTALLDYSKYVQCLMELNETEDPLLHFNEASGYGQYIHKSSVKTFATHIENDFLLCLPSCSEGPTNPEIENRVVLSTIYFKGAVEKDQYISVTYSDGEFYVIP